MSGPTRRIGVLLCVSLPILVSAHAAEAPDVAAGAYESLLEDAQKAIASGNVNGGLAALDQAVRMRPDGEEALSLLGRAYLEMKRYPQASAALRRAVALADRAPQALEARLRDRTDLAVALARDEKSDQAIDVLREVLAIAPERATIHHDMGRIEMGIGRLEDAAAAFREEIALLAKSPGSSAQDLASSLEGLGIASYRLGDDRAAIDAFEKRSKLEGLAETVEGSYHHGLVLARLGRAEEAAARFRETLRLDPDHRGALQNLARADAALGLDEERKSSLSRFQALYTKEEEAKSRKIKVGDLRAEARRRADGGDASGAVALLAEAARLAPDEVEIQLDLGRYRHRAGDLEGGERTLRALLESHPLDAEAHFLLGRILADRGDVQGALAAFVRASQIEPMSLSYHTSLAQTYLRMRRNEEGLRELRLSRSLDPANPEAAFNLGLGLAQSGALREAVDAMREAIRIGYSDPIAHQVLAQIYTALGETDRAAEEKAAFERMRAPSKKKP